MPTCWRGIENAPPEFLSALERAASERGWDYDSLLGHISHESSFNPAAKSFNSSARGLIQMIDEVSRKFAGVPSEKLTVMSHMEQLPGLLAYFDSAGGHAFKGADFLLWGFSSNPSLLTASDSRVIYPAGSKEALANKPALDPSGALTVGSVRNEWRKWTQSTAHKCKQAVPEAPEKASLSGPFVAIIAFTGFYFWARRR